MAFSTTTKATMDNYFGINNDVRYWSYISFSDGMRLAAFNQAVREIQSVLGQELYDPSDTTDYTGIREDLAVYEQAYWILENTEIKKGQEGKVVIDLAKDEEYNTVQRKELLLSPKARRYLRQDFIRIARG